MSFGPRPRANCVYRMIAPADERIAFAWRSASAGRGSLAAKSSTRNCHSRSARICCGALPSASRLSSSGAAVRTSRRTTAFVRSNTCDSIAPDTRARMSGPDTGSPFDHAASFPSSFSMRSVSGPIAVVSDSTACG